MYSSEKDILVPIKEDGIIRGIKTRKNWRKEIGI